MWKYERRSNYYSRDCRFLIKKRVFFIGLVESENLSKKTGMLSTGGPIPQLFI